LFRIQKKSNLTDHPSETQIRSIPDHVKWRERSSSVTPFTSLQPNKRQAYHSAFYTPTNLSLSFLDFDATLEGTAMMHHTINRGLKMFGEAGTHAVAVAGT
jgi:hypothetical protein